MACKVWSRHRAMLADVTTGHGAPGSRRRVLRRRRRVAAGAVVLALVVLVTVLVDRVGGASSEAELAEPPPSTQSSSPEAEGTPGDGASPVPASPSETSPTPSAEATVPQAESATVPQADPATALAGIRSPGVPDVGTGVVDVVPGTVAAPDPAARVVQVRVGVEGGLPVDGTAFASFVMSTLNDGRSWAGEGKSFARTDGEADVEVVLASPRTSAAMCRPLDTGGTLSCHNDGRAVITYYRWANGSDDYAADLTGYRQYVVNHEVGHYLGHGHVACPAAGQLAPVMMQQTKGIGACVTNPWPFP